MRRLLTWLAVVVLAATCVTGCGWCGGKKASPKPAAPAAPAAK